MLVNTRAGPGPSMRDALLAAAIGGWISALFISIFLHRAVAHQALRLHPAVAHVMRFWLWCVTGT